MRRNNKTRRAEARRNVIAMRRRSREESSSCYSAIIRALPSPTINLRALLCPSPRKIRLLLACHEFPRNGGRGLHVVDRQGRSFDRRSRLARVRRASPTPPSAMLPLLAHFSILRPPVSAQTSSSTDDHRLVTRSRCFFSFFFSPVTIRLLASRRVTRQTRRY